MCFSLTPFSIPPHATLVWMAVVIHEAEADVPGRSTPDRPKPSVVVVHSLSSSHPNIPQQCSFTAVNRNALVRQLYLHIEKRVYTTLCMLTVGGWMVVQLKGSSKNE